MPKNVIHIYGASGSGTTTLGSGLAKNLGYFFMDVDEYYWEKTDIPFTKPRSVVERLKLILDDIKTHDNIVISGSLTDWGDGLIPYFTLVVRTVLDTNERIKRINEREYNRFKDRILPGGDMYDNHLSFIDWCKQYDEGDVSIRSKANHDLFQRKLTCRVIMIDTSIPVDQNIKKITYSLNPLKLELSDISDASKLALISTNAFNSDIYMTGVNDGPPDYNDVSWHEKMIKDKRIYNIICNDEMIGGAIIFYNETRPDTLYLGRIFIDPFYHRLGLGEKAMKLIEAKYKDVLLFKLDTPIWNTRTNNLYDKLGYTLVRSEDDTNYYEKRLSK